MLPSGLAWGLALPLAVDDPASLDRLVDIVPGPPAPWWPPAPGWFVVGGVFVTGLVAAAIWLGKRWHRHAYRRAALRELARIAAAGPDDERAWTELPALLKRVSLAAYPRSAVANLAGAAWLRFLDQTAGRTLFAAGPGETLLALAYDPQAPRRLTPEALQQSAAAAREWVHRHAETLPNGSAPEGPPC